MCHNYISLSFEHNHDIYTSHAFYTHYLLLLLSYRIKFRDILTFLIHLEFRSPVLRRIVYIFSLTLFLLYSRINCIESWCIDHFEWQFLFLKPILISWTLIRHVLTFQTHDEIRERQKYIFKNIPPISNSSVVLHS